MRQFKEMLYLGTPGTVQHTDLQTSGIRRDKDDVKLMMSLLKGSWIKLYEEQDLVCLPSGKLATPEIEKDLLQTEAFGEKAGKTFCRDRLESDPPKVKFCNKT